MIHTMIGDFTEIILTNSDNNLHLVRMSTGLDGRMLDASGDGNIEDGD